MRYTIILRPGQGDTLLLEIEDHDGNRQSVYGVHFPSREGMVRLELGEEIEPSASGDAYLTPVVPERTTLQGE
jgi:hypothetical protein